MPVEAIDAVVALDEDTMVISLSRDVEPSVDSGLRGMSRPVGDE